MGRDCEYWKDDMQGSGGDDRPICERIGVKIDPTICLTTCQRFWPKGFNLQKWLDTNAKMRDEKYRYELKMAELDGEIRDLKRQGVKDGLIIMKGDEWEVVSKDAPTSAECTEGEHKKCNMPDLCACKCHGHGGRKFVKEVR